MADTALIAASEDYLSYDYQADLDTDVPPISDLQRLYSPYQRRLRFLQALAHGMSATWSARYAGNSRMQFYNWQKEIPAFGEAWKAEHDEAGGDIWEDLLLQKAQSNNPASVTAVAIGLKMRKRFVENAPQSSGPIQVTILEYRLPGQPQATQVTVGQVPQIESPNAAD